MEKAENVDYAICVSKETFGKWGKVVEILKMKHKEKNPIVVTYTKSISECRAVLAKALPYYTCFVAMPIECTREFVTEVIFLTSTLTSHSYGDTIWGILTSPDVETALSIASTKDPLIVSHSIANCRFQLAKCYSGASYSELYQGKSYIKDCKSCEIKEEGCDPDNSALLVDKLNQKKGEPVDLIITSGHATEHELNLGHYYNGGVFTHMEDSNTLFSQDSTGVIRFISSLNPKVYIAAGNCLIGHVLQEGPCMALSWMKSAKVVQMVGYTMETWFGYGGWGVLKYFVEMAGSYTLAQSFFANMQSMIYHIESSTDISHLEGCEYDSKYVAFYGDPAFEARLMSPVPSSMNPNLYNITAKEGVKGGQQILTITTTGSGSWSCEAGDDRYTAPGREPIYFFPKRLKNPKVVKGDIIVTSLFALFKLSGTFASGFIYEAIIEDDS